MRGRARRILAAAHYGRGEGRDRKLCARLHPTRGACGHGFGGLAGKRSAADAGENCRSRHNEVVVRGEISVENPVVAVEPGSAQGNTRVLLISSLAFTLG